MNEKVIEYKGYDCVVVASKYSYNDKTAFQLIAANTEKNQKNDVFHGEPIDKVTVCLPEYDEFGNEKYTFVKSEEALKMLVENGFVEYTGLSVNYGHGGSCKAYYVKCI